MRRSYRSWCIRPARLMSSICSRRSSTRVLRAHARAALCASRSHRFARFAPKSPQVCSSPHRLKPVFCCAQTCVRDPSATAGRRGREVFNFVSSQADALGGSDSASVVLAILDAVSNPHENMAKVLELLPKLMLPVLPSCLPGYA